MRSLRALPLFADLAASELEELSGLVEERTFDAHQAITREGRLWEGLYVVKSGKVKMTRRIGVQQAGRELTIAVLGPGDPVNMTALFEGDRNVFTTEALTPAALWVLPGARARAFVSRHPAMQRALLRALNWELRRLVSLASRLAFSGVTARLAFSVFEQTRLTGVRTDRGVAIRRDLTLNDLASLVGTTRRVISKSLSELRHDGVIAVEPSRLVVLDEDRLAEIAGLRQHARAATRAGRDSSGAGRAPRPPLAN
ncbi:MAG: Crp/Fnr family transcriptional regulator [Acidobacteria bacterium]|nr:Crp/Fnr family transcriptional regulator [Acidobacteriota bacterium]